MGWIRFIHFTAAYVFAIGLAVRVYWSLVGNKYSNWRTFFPYLNKPDREKMIATFRYYFFLDRKLPHVVGHNAVAASSYFLVFLLYLGMIVSGFTLYSEHAPGGMMHKLLGWITTHIQQPDSPLDPPQLHVAADWIRNQPRLQLLADGH